MESGPDVSEITPSEKVSPTEVKESRMKKLNSNETFQRLAPSFTEYWKNKPEAQDPYLHGTGSYALRNILKNGLTPRNEEDRVTGEAAQLSLGTPKSVVSLAIDSEAGEILARTYAYASSKELGLSFNADEYSQNNRVARTIAAVGGKEAFVERVLSRDTEGKNAEYVEQKKESLNFETEILLNNALKYGGYVFSPETAKANIESLISLTRGEIEDFDTIRKILFLNGILQGKITPEVLDKIPEINDDNSWIREQIQEAIERWKSKIIKYEGLPEPEREKIEHQFPAVLMVEGSGSAIENPNLPLQEERVVAQTISPDKIKEIRVPEKYLELVQEWLEEEKLKNVAVTPLEYYEIHEVLVKT